MVEQSEFVSMAMALAPAALFVLAAALSVWLVWRVLCRLLRSPERRTEDVSVPLKAFDGSKRREPVLEPVTPSAVSTIPDAADVLALKASIDALTRQIASLEKRLAPAAPGSTVVAHGSPAARDEENSRISVGPRLFS